MWSIYTLFECYWNGILVLILIIIFPRRNVTFLTPFPFNASKQVQQCRKKTIKNTPICHLLWPHSTQSSYTVATCGCYTIAVCVHLNVDKPPDCTVPPEDAHPWPGPKMLEYVGVSKDSYRMKCMHSFHRPRQCMFWMMFWGKTA